MKKLFLFVHFVMPPDAAMRSHYMAKWQELITTEGPNPDNAICILSSASNKKLNEIEGELVPLALACFGDRCVLDPCDDSAATKILLAEDLLRMLRYRGRFMQWTPYEIWTSGMARRWTEGLKRELRERGHTYDPATLQVVACGQQWAGCLTKYAMLMPTYLGVTRKPEVRVDLSTGAGWPLEGAHFVEHIALERHVSLFLFETAEGRPMGQFLDGLRAIWEPPHVAVVTIDPAKIEIHTATLNDHFPPQISARFTADQMVADVGDGCHPRLATIIGQKGAARDFRAALARARIEPVMGPLVTFA